MAPNIARADRVGRAELIEFLSGRHHALLITDPPGRRRADLAGDPAGWTVQGRLVVSTYPARAKVTNIRRSGRATACVLSDDWDGPYVQIEGPGRGPGPARGAGRAGRLLPGHRRRAPGLGRVSGRDCKRQGKCLIRLTVQRWGPIAAGGFPPEHVPS